MKMEIEIMIETEETWQELCGGKIKSILHHHLNKLKQDLKVHINADMTEEWYSSNDSNCKTCAFNIDNDAGMYSHAKSKNTSVNDCALNPEVICGEDLRFTWTEGHTCPHYKVSEAYQQKMTFGELEEFKQKLNSPN